MTGREMRAVRIGSAVIIALLGVRAVPALRSAHMELKQDVAARKGTLEGALAAAEAFPALEQEAVQLKSAYVSLAPGLLPGATRPAALRGAATQVGSVARRHGARVDTQKPEPDSATGGTLRAVSLRTSMTGDTRVLLSTLASIATSQPVLELREISVAATDPSSDPGTPEQLSISIVTRGWYLEGRGQ